VNFPFFSTGRTKGRLLAAALAAALTPPVHAGLAEEAEALFNGMLNGTAPSSHMGQRRGVFDGGSAVARSRIMNESLWRFTQPRAEAGCGGIDLYAGSFSFISGDQFQQLMRQVAANAPGYAFQLAIKSMCPECGEIMDSLQKVLQALNQGHVNSCELAQGIVNDITPDDAEWRKHKTKASLKGSVERGWTDFHSAVTGISGTTGIREVGRNMSSAEQAEEGLSGNLVWYALVRRGVSDWFTHGGRDLLEGLMSITGSFVVHPPQEDASGGGDNSNLTPLPPTLTVRDFLFAGDEFAGGGAATQRVRRYRCNGGTNAHQCLSVTPIDDNDFTGMNVFVRRMFLGRPGQVGIVDKYAIAGAAPTAAEESFISSIPGGFGARLRALAGYDVGMARDYARRASPAIAMEMVEVVVDDALRAVTHATAIQRNTYAGVLQQQISEVRQQIEQEKAGLRDRLGNYIELLDYYTNLIRSAKRDTGPIGTL
jgi:conjugative transfer pilus assembly protein TraH